MSNQKFTDTSTSLRSLTEQQAALNHEFELARLTEFYKLCEIINQNPDLIDFYANALLRSKQIREIAETQRASGHLESAARFDVIAEQTATTPEFEAFFALFAPTHPVVSELGFIAIVVEPVVAETAAVADPVVIQPPEEVINNVEPTTTIDVPPVVTDIEPVQTEAIPLVVATETEQSSSGAASESGEQQEAKTAPIDPKSPMMLLYILDRLAESQEGLRAEVTKKRDDFRPFIDEKRVPAETFRIGLAELRKYLESKELPEIVEEGVARGVKYFYTPEQVDAARVLLTADIEVNREKIEEIFGVQNAEAEQPLSDNESASLVVETPQSPVVSFIEREFPGDRPFSRDSRGVRRDRSIEPVLRTDGVWLNNRRTREFTEIESEIIQLLANSPRKEAMRIADITARLNGTVGGRFYEVEAALAALAKDLPENWLQKETLSKSRGIGWRLGSGVRPKTSQKK